MQKYIFFFTHKSFFFITDTIFIFANVNFKNSNMAYQISDKCVACGTCISECPVEAIAEGPIYTIDPDVCVECGTCAAVCPQEAIQLGE